MLKKSGFIARMAKQSFGIIGTGAFGTLMARHLAPHFSLVLHDAHKNPAKLAKACKAKTGSLQDAAVCGIVVIAVPVQQIEGVLKQIAPLLKPKTLVIDVGSVKTKPATLMRTLLPENVDSVGTHPLFGPQSGKNGIKGLNIAVCDVRGKRGACVAKFLKTKLKLRVFRVTPEEHDRELAYVQGLTHLLAKIIVGLDLPPFKLTTKTFEHLLTAVDMVRYDSDDLFRAIERENPFALDAKARFFTAARMLEERLAGK
jgi:prephenate dehydrogenase